MSAIFEYPHIRDVRHALTSHGVESGFVPTPIMYSIIVAEILLLTPLLPRIKTSSVAVKNKKIIFPETNILKILKVSDSSYKILNYEVENGVMHVERTPSRLDFYQKPQEEINITYLYGFINGNVRPVVYDIVFNIAMSYDLRRIKFENHNYINQIKPLCEDYRIVEKTIQETRHHG